MTVYIVVTPAWDPEFDSAWTTEEKAQDRADVLDPADEDGVRWDIILKIEVDANPDALDYQGIVERRELP